MSSSRGLTGGQRPFHTPGAMAPLDLDASFSRRIRPQTDRSITFRRLLILLGAAALISVVATGWISVHTSNILFGAIAALDEARAVLLEIDHFTAALAEAESDARGYVITGLPSFVREFEGHARSVEAHAQKLLSLAQTDDDRRLILALGSHSAERLRLLREMVHARSGGAPIEETIPRVARGERIGRRVREAATTFRSSQVRTLEKHTSAARAARNFSFYAPLTSAIIALSLISLTLFQAARTFRVEQMLREELRRAVTREHAARTRAQEADRMKDRFLAAISHDLRSPLTAITGWCSVLSHAEDRSELLEEGLKSINDAARVQSRLVEDLLDVSRYAAGKLTLRPAETRLADVLDSAVASMVPLAQQKGVALRKSVEADIPPMRADAERLQQVVVNLVSNAIKFTPSGGNVEVSVRVVDGQAEITVRDDGEGVAPELLTDIFNPFRQAAPSGTRQGGLGLGLAIVKHLVELHGGEVHAFSAGRGRGSTFAVRLPLLPA